MSCPRCNEATEPGAMFCGNCGQSLQAGAPSPAPSPLGSPMAAIGGSPAAVPVYAIADPLQHKAETRSMIGLIAAVLSLPGALIPFLGGVLAVAGAALAVTSRRTAPKKTMATIALVFAGLGLALSAAGFAYNLTQYNKVQSAKPAQASLGDSDSRAAGSGNRAADLPAVANNDRVDTPCFSLSLAMLKHSTNATGSCNLQAYNAATLNASSSTLAVESIRQTKANDANFDQIAKAWVNDYLTQSLSGYVLVSQKPAIFATSKAYVVNAKKADGSTTIQVFIVLHPTSNGENLFIVAQAIDNDQANASAFEPDWTWK